MRGSLRLLKNEASFASLLRVIEQGAESAIVEGLFGSSLGLFIAQLAHLCSRQLLVVVDDDQAARATFSDVCFFLNVSRGCYSEQDGVFFAGDGLSAGARDDVFLLPARSTEPFEMFSPPPAEVAARHLAYRAARSGQARVIIAPVESLLAKIVPREVVEAFVLELSVGQQLDLADAAATLLSAGYSREYLAEQPGSFAIRGGIMDIFPPGQEYGARIELADDRIDSVRKFDPTTQRSVANLDSVVVVPASEVILSEQAADLAVQRLASFSPRSDQYLHLQSVIEGFEQRRHFGGIENYAVFAYERLEEPLAALGEEICPVIATHSPIEQRVQKFHRSVKRAAETTGRTSIFFAEEMLGSFVSPDEFQRRIAKRPKLIVPRGLVPGLEVSKEQMAEPLRTFQFRTGAVTAVGNDVVFILLGLFAREDDASLATVHIVCHTPTQARKMRRLLLSDETVAGESEPGGMGNGFCLADLYREGRVKVWVGRVSKGFKFPDLGFTVVSEEELLGSKIAAKRRRAREAEDRMLDFASLCVGDYVVHVDYGVGKYVGLTTHIVDGRPVDYMTIVYAGNDCLYVPVEDLRGVQKYVGSGDVKPRLDRMGGSAWAKAVSRARRATQQMAKELLELYAARKALPGFAFSPDGPWQYRFELMFEYDETRDQLLAIEDVKNDMQTARPMDRLICGDVGYGKTEVALRAAFKAVSDGKQVAVLVPTTVLAQQHYETFRKRFEPFPFTVEMLSRFRSKTRQKQIIKAIKQGTVDIVIGTHRLIQNDVEFNDLGLVIIDEEHRFGVRHKEKLKQLRKQVDVLTMTATPIPRTLHMALSEIRDMSIIDTPPEDRLAIQTRIVRFDKSLIREAIIREMSRGGQVYFVHNRVRSIDSLAGMVKRLVPEARIAVAHGQMPESELERIMVKFVKHEYDVLVCTAIIESGIDIPSVNTIIINRADRFGLAQLYQLRGRVGRYKHQAWAYLMIPNVRTITPDARKRLAVINELTELGSGFRIATYDLQIRGAGNLLGPEQHGHMNAVGFYLYCDLLKEAVRQIKGEPTPEKVPEPTFNLPVDAIIPQDYIADPDLRLVMYRKLISCGDGLALDEIRAEMLDRFGPLPSKVQNLLRLVGLKQIARELGLEMVSKRGENLYLQFREESPLRSEDVALAMMDSHDAVTVLSNNAAVIPTRSLNGETVLEKLESLLGTLRRLLAVA